MPPAIFDCDRLIQTERTNRILQRDTNKNRDPIKKQTWYQKNKVKILARQKIVREATRGKRLEQARARYAADPEKVRTYRRNSQYKTKFGITLAQFEAMFVAQGGLCAAGCGTQLRPWHGRALDHCHATGNVRGILCRPCNLTLGNVKDSPEQLERLAAYLRRFT